MSNNRDKWVMMSRIRNEARWIVRNLERTFQVVSTVVLWDDGSDDDTEAQVLKAVTGRERNLETFGDAVETAWGWIHSWRLGDGSACELHYIHSPFRPAVRPKQSVSEIRDKNALWEYVKAKVPFEFVLCLDGDEMLSQAAVRAFPELTTALHTGAADMVHIPFVYLWDREDQQRVDGIYGVGPDGLPRLRFPRAFSVRRVTEQQLFDMRFAWEGTKGGFHCGSVPRESFHPAPDDLRSATWRAPIIHFGYLHDADRRKKWEFYNQIDPNNEFEGRYMHIIGEPNQHAPGPVQLVPYEDV